MSGALDKSVIDGDTILLRISEECDRHWYVYIGGNMVCTFLTKDKFYKYISIMGNNLTPYSKAIGMENIYFSNILNLLREKRLMMMICWKQMNILLIHMIIVFHNVEKTRLKT